MKTKKINDGDIAELRISSLPTRPTAPSTFGGKGYTATEMKAAFDKLPLYIIECFNNLVGDITAPPEEGISSSIPTGIKEGHTLAELFLDIESGALASYLTVLGSPLAVLLGEIKEELEEIKEKIK